MDEEVIIEELIEAVEPLDPNILQLFVLNDSNDPIMSLRADKTCKEILFAYEGSAWFNLTAIDNVVATINVARTFLLQE